ncbi:EF-hand domain-containing protein [Roseovarius sp. C7]|uniref:EF-hand domain-containing protein n=1 Tax=Roseovarius sp. C7 TaxID=3398643 RepID=UPI0039F5974F
MTKYIALVLGMGLMANSAFAMNEGIAEINTNGDGLITADELSAVFPDVTAEAFAEIDADGNGAVDDAEMQAATEAGLIPAKAE